MKPRVLFATLAVAIACLAAESGMETYQRAVTQERSGNLEDAIKTYEKVAHDFASDHPLAAKALMSAARCTETLGLDNAARIYEQVARDFADQREPAAAARAKLASLRAHVPPATITQRKIEVLGGDRTFGGPFSDGQRAIYKDTATNTLVIGDLEGNNKRVVYEAKPGETFTFMPSRDLSMVWLHLRAPSGQVTQAIIKSDGSGYRELFQGNPYGGLRPAWSWDDRYLLYVGVPPGPPFNGATSLLLIELMDAGAVIALPAGNVIGGGVVMVSVADGKGREVIRRDSSVPSGAFSPDGRFIAFSEMKTPGEGRILVVPVQGGEPRQLSQDANLLDWTADGRFVVVSSKSSGPEALTLLPVRDGQLSGNPVFVRDGSFLRGHTTPSGALDYASYGPGLRAFLARVGPNGHLGAWSALDLKIGATRAFGPIYWSPDGTQISYISRRDDAGVQGGAVRIYNVASDEDREVYRTASGADCRWETKRPNLFCIETVGSVPEALTVVVDSGHVERLGSVTLPRTPDSMEQLARSKGIEVASEAVRARVTGGYIEVRPTLEADWKRLAGVDPTLNFFAFGAAVTPAGVVYRGKDSNGKQALFRVSFEGGQPERLGDVPEGLSEGAVMVRPSPDGRNIMIEGNAGKVSETWLLENFEPKPPAAR